MSRLTLTVKSLLALGAATAITIKASADVTKPTPPTTEEAKSAVAGGGAGKATFKELTAADAPGIKDESQTTINAGCEPYPACARNKEAMEEEIAAPVKSEGFKPAATGEIEKRLAGGDDDNDGFYWEASIDVIARPDDQTPNEDAETSAEAWQAMKIDGIDGETVDKATVKDGEDRLTENLELNYSTVKGEVSEDIEDAAEKTDPPKDLGSERPRPMQRR